jgi:hypothetical protein
MSFAAASRRIHKCPGALNQHRVRYLDLMDFCASLLCPGIGFGNRDLTAARALIAEPN